MKSHELAKKLLELPDLDLYTEVKHLGGANWEYRTEKLNGETTITPTGLFLKPSTGYIKGYADKSPNDEPVIGSYMLFFSDGLVVKDKWGEDRACTPTVKYLSTGETTETVPTVSINGTEILTEFHSNHKVYHRAHDANIVLVTNRETYEANPLYTQDGVKYDHRYVEDIDYVKVLVSYDPVTWWPTYNIMTYAEAIEYGKNL